ncbi:MAG: peptidoglycan DD-metalloendopeptidase family protein [Balneolaceae bacterium]|nr:peptidoglycan DD-metalloendopeptidase family protein [Balneolaceae bacterium]MBO6546522.1 peptidoglycan DD-metalloendopeptidase family protein [Balneolaceae bacterium]MBO6648881.1 peptidoglycan DD-metalloendopeptidase family protein [Balneolaceae bacterium]
MYTNRVKEILQSIGILTLFASCSLFQSNDLEGVYVDSVSLESLIEIKEQPVLDEYGFHQKGDIITENKVKRNESLYIILRSLDVSPQTIYELEKESEGKFQSNRIRPGQRYLTYLDSETNAVNRLILHNDLLNYVVIDLEDQVKVERGRKEITSKITETSGVITSSLYESLLENNIDPLLGNKLSEIFGWQIDFFRIYENDSYKVIYEQQYVGDEPYGVGKILAAEFTHKNEVFDAFFYETNDRAGYFDSEGKGVQKALLKAPFTYSQRVSSNFSHSRFHPVLKTRRPHYGVDYAAPLGTPVIAVGDGTVTESRYRGANGNIVKIQHNSTYTTAYLHLNGFARGIKRGAKVKQGQVIGYVGRTGRVTGVHLDYRIYKNDQPVNPLTVDLPPSKAITETEMKKFQFVVDKFRFQLSQIGEGLIASAYYTY